MVIIYKYHTNTSKNLTWVVSDVIQESFNQEAKPIAQNELDWVGRRAHIPQSLLLFLSMGKNPECTEKQTINLQLKIYFSDGELLIAVIFDFIFFRMHVEVVLVQTSRD